MDLNGFRASELYRQKLTLHHFAYLHVWPVWLIWTFNASRCSRCLAYLYILRIFQDVPRCSKMFQGCSSPALVLARSSWVHVGLPMLRCCFLVLQKPNFNRQLRQLPERLRTACPWDSLQLPNIINIHYYTFFDVLGILLALISWLFLVSIDRAYWLWLWTP